MKATIKTKIAENKYILRSINNEDIETIRQWKNQNKEYFFYKKDISYEEQIAWFDSLNKKMDDHMFIILDGEHKVGTIGIRLYGEFADIYNVILGDENYKGIHLMTHAIWATARAGNLLFPNKPIRVRVLNTNPAIKWYEKIGFNRINYFEDHVLLEIRIERIKYSYDFELKITLPITNN